MTLTARTFCRSVMLHYWVKKTGGFRPKMKCIAEWGNLSLTVLAFGTKHIRRKIYCDSLIVTPPSIGERGVLWWECLSVCLCVCVCVCLSVHDHINGTTHPILSNFLCMLPMAVARSSSGGVVIRYVFPVLRMTSYLHISWSCSTSPPWAWRVGIPVAGSGHSRLLLAVRAYWAAVACWIFMTSCLHIMSLRSDKKMTCA